METIVVDRVGTTHRSPLYKSCVVRLRCNGWPFRVAVYEFTTDQIHTDCWRFEPKDKRWVELGQQQAQGLRQTAVDAYKTQANDMGVRVDDYGNS